MENKNLPIRIFEKRKKVDDRKTEGGGSDNLPVWMKNIPEEQIWERAENFMDKITEVSKKLKQRLPEQDFIPATLQLDLNEHATAKTYRADIADIFKVENEQNFIGCTGEKSVLIKISTEKEALAIAERLKDAKKYMLGIAAITDLVEYEPTINIHHAEIDSPLRVSLLNYNNYQLNESVANTFEKICIKYKVSYKKGNYSADLIVYRLENATVDSFEEISKFNALESISLMPKYSVVSDDFSPTTKKIKVKKPIEGKNYTIVGVLDSGIERTNHLAPWVLSEVFSKVPNEFKDTSHGTFVAGIIVYGDELEGEDFVGDEGVYLFDATVYPGKDEIEEIDLVENIREAISQHSKQIKIWNLSLGTNKEANINDFSYFGKALDSIQERYDVLICKSAGNCKNFLLNKPVSRIAVSADSIRSLVIGSVAHEQGEYDIARIYHRSPFSRIGKGPSHINKPELVHFGGNAGIDENGKLTISGVNSFAPDGSIVKNVGTSFSTPRISSLTAQLENQIDGDFNSLLLKALTIHSAKYPKELSIPAVEKIKSLGYGIPSNVSNILYNDPYEITLILQDTLIKGNWIEISDFPFPAEMVDGKYFYGEIILTLVSSPLLSDTNGFEYCQSNLDIRLGTYEKLKPRRGRTIRNEVGLDAAENILKDGLYAAKYKKYHTGDFAKERTLIKYGDKYQPIKKYAINLEEMTDANKEHFLTAPKKWYLQVEGLYRDFIIKDSEINGVELSQDFCLIVTIRDSKRKHRVYDLSTQLLNTNGFIHSDIRLRNDVKIPVNI